MRRKIAAAKLCVLTVFLLTATYLQTCLWMGFHFRSLAEQYANKAISISDSWSDPSRFTPRSECEMDRYLSAGIAASEYKPFGAVWMVRNWNRDFLNEQPPCQ